MTEARSVVVRLTAETAQYIREMQAAGKVSEDAMTSAERATSRQGQALDTLGGKAGRMALATTAALVASGKAAVDWESQFAGVEKTVDGTASQMATLEGELRGLARTLPATHQEIAATAEAAGQLGVAREDISDFTATMVDLAETTDLTADQAATNIAQISNVMGTAGDDVDNLGSALVALGNAGASTESQILGMAQRIAGAGAQIGLAESDILAIANAAASMGIEVEAGGSAISRVFTDMAKATAQGGEDLEAFAEVAGVSIDEFVRQFEEDPARAFAAFTEGLNRINESGGDVFTTLDQLGLSDVRVSQALLSMAASGDLLTDSLDLGAQAWSENTALADEAAKRYETTAAKVQVAWNQIRDAGIEAGAAVLPVVADIASGVGAAADAFGRLPDPVQSSVTKLLALTSVVGGAAWFGSKVIRGVTDTRIALADLADVSPRTATALGRVASAAGTLTILATVGAGVGSLVADLTGANLELSDLSRNLDAVSEGIENRALGQIIDDLKIVSDRGISDGIGETVLEVASLNGVFGMFSTTLDAATSDLEAVDQQLAALVESGRGDDAAKIFETIAAGLYDLPAGASIGQDALDELLGTFDSYGTAVDTFAASSEEGKEALTGVPGAARDAAGATEQLAGASDRAASSSRAEADAIRDAIDAMREKRAEALSAFDAETRYGQALAAARQEAGEGAKGLSRLTEEGRANRAALSELAAAWNNQSDAVKNAQGRMANARRDFIDTATAMGVPREQARELARELLEIPTRVVTQADAHTEVADRKVQAHAGLLRALDGRTANTYTNHYETTIYRQMGVRVAGYTGAGGLLKADGGQVRGPGTTTSDSIPAWLSDREYVVKAAAVDHYGVDLFDRLNAMRLADGGLVANTHATARGYANGGRAIANFDPNIRDGAGKVRLELAQLERAIRAAGDWSKGLERMTDRMSKMAGKFDKMSATLDDLKSTRGSIRDGAAGAFSNDPFTGGLAGFDLQVKANTNDYNSLIKVMRKLKRKGLDGPLAHDAFASGNLSFLQELAELGRGQIARREVRYERMERRSDLAGTVAVNASGINGDIKGMANDMRAMKRGFDQLEKKIENGVRAGAREGTKAGMAGRGRDAAQRSRAGR